MADRASRASDASSKKTGFPAPVASESGTRIDLASEFDPNPYDDPSDPRRALWRHRIEYLRRIVRLSPAAPLLLHGDPPKGGVTWPWADLSIPLSSNQAPKEISGDFDSEDIAIVAYSMDQCAKLDERLAALSETPQAPAWYKPYSDMEFELALQPILGVLPRDAPDLSGVHPLVFPHFVVEGPTARPAAEDEVGTPISVFLFEERLRRERKHLEAMCHGQKVDHSYITRLNFNFQNINHHNAVVEEGFENAMIEKSWSDSQISIRPSLFKPTPSQIAELSDQRSNILWGLLQMIDHGVLEELIALDDDAVVARHKKTVRRDIRLPPTQKSDLSDVMDALNEGAPSIRQAIFAVAKSKGTHSIPKIPTKPFGSLSLQQREIWEEAIHNRYTRSITRALDALSEASADSPSTGWKPSDLKSDTVRKQIRALLAS